jgi:Fe-S cluster assembly protein SufD
MRQRFSTCARVPRDIATDLLVLAFIDEAIAEIADERLAADIRHRLELWLGRRRQG